jgi:short-subunit dehydrogenase
MHKEVKWAIITGASGGIGRELALEITRRWYHPILVGRSSESLDAVALSIQQEFEIEAITLLADLSDESGWRSIKGFIDEHMLEPQVLINNAGVGIYGNLSDTESEDLSSMIDINIRATTELTRIFSRDFAEQWCGYILNIASLAGLAPMPNMAVYGASKAYIVSLSLAMREELKESNVMISVSCPGPVDTKFLIKNGFESANWAHDDTNILSPHDVAKRSITWLFANEPIILHRRRDIFTAYFLRIIPTKWSLALLSRLTK